MITVWEIGEREILLFLVFGKISIIAIPPSVPPVAAQLAVLVAAIAIAVV